MKKLTKDIYSVSITELNDFGEGPFAIKKFNSTASVPNAPLIPEITLTSASSISIFNISCHCIILY